MFVWRTTVKLHDTDAAGLLFYGHQFKMAHDCYEALLESIGFPMAWWLRESDCFLPIVHASADFKLPLFVGDKIEIRLRVEKLGQSSYTLAQDIVDSKGRSVGTVTTVHVVVDKKSGRKTPIPDKFRAALEKL
ncbi:MAG: acyl-CoA thioesterase [candidate division Zixibacteria bacterium]|nr:acyl-CoA thioesterase [candidate division Zixibacteria bacterium]